MRFEPSDDGVGGPVDVPYVRPDDVVTVVHQVHVGCVVAAGGKKKRTSPYTHTPQVAERKKIVRHLEKKENFFLSFYPRPKNNFSTELT